MRNTELERTEPYRKKRIFPDFQIILPDRRTETLISPPDGSLGEFGAVHSICFLSEEETEDLRFRPTSLSRNPHPIALRDEQKKLADLWESAKANWKCCFARSRWKRLGSRLVQYGIDGFGIREVCVNEQKSRRERVL